MRWEKDKHDQSYCDISNIRVTKISGDHREHPGQILVSFRKYSGKGDGTQRGPEMLIRERKDVMRFIAILTFLSASLNDIEVLEGLATSTDCEGQPYFNISNIRITLIPGENRDCPGENFLSFREYVSKGVHRGPEMHIESSRTLQKLIVIMEEIAEDL